jgi:hypothetical protein
MKMFGVVALVAIVSFGASPVRADTWVQGTISEIQVVANGNADDKILVFGTFTPATGCTNNAFMLISTDHYFAQTFAMLLSAQMSGSTIKYLHSFCLNGYGRGNGYAVIR